MILECKLMIIKCTELCRVAIKTPPWAVSLFSFFGGFPLWGKMMCFIRRIFCAKKHLMTLPCRVFPVTFNARQTPLSSLWLAKAARASRKWNFNTRNKFFFVYFVQIGWCPHLRKIKFQTQEIQTKVFKIRLHLLLSWENENLCFNIKIIL